MGRCVAKHESFEVYSLWHFTQGSFVHFQRGKKYWPPTFQNAVSCYRARQDFESCISIFPQTSLLFSLLWQMALLCLVIMIPLEQLHNFFMRRIWKYKTGMILEIKLPGTTWHKERNINKKRWKKAEKFSSGIEAQAWIWEWRERVFCAEIFQDWTQT